MAKLKIQNKQKTKTLRITMWIWVIFFGVLLISNAILRSSALENDNEEETNGNLYGFDEENDTFATIDILERIIIK